MVFFGRLLVGSYFIIDGFSKLADYGESADAIAQYGIPLAGLFVLLIAVPEIVVAVLMITRFHAKLGSAFLTLFIIGEILFTQTASHLTAEIQNAILIKNLLIIGSLLSIYSHSRGIGSWHFHNTRIRPADERFELDN